MMMMQPISQIYFMVVFYPRLEIKFDNYSWKIINEALINMIGRENNAYFCDLIAYLQHRILPTNEQRAKRILHQEEHYCPINDILFRLPRPRDIEDDTKLRLQLVIPDHLFDYIISAKHDKFMGTGGRLNKKDGLTRYGNSHRIESIKITSIGKC